MAVVFPTTPAPNQVVTDPVTNATWRWDAPGQRWVPAATGAVFATQEWVEQKLAGQEVFTGPSAPPPPNSTGDLWFDTLNNQLMVYDGANWIASAPITPTGFLPLTGGTLSGNLAVVGSLNATGAGWFGDLLNVAPGFFLMNRPATQERLLSWQANWYDAFNTANGYRSYVANGTAVLSIAPDGTQTMLGDGIYYSKFTSDSIAFQWWGGSNLSAIISGTSIGTIPYTPSDLMIKRAPGPSLIDALADLIKIPLRSFDQQVTPEGPIEHVPIGLVAQQLKDVAPDAVTETPREGGTDDMLLSVRLLPLLARCIGAIQQLSARVEALEAKL